MKAILLIATLGLVLTSSTEAGSRGGAAPVKTLHRLSFEFVGQFQNSPPGVSPATHVHYGYLSYASGLPAFTGPALSETTALFTFYADAVPVRTIANGPLRIVTRVGKLTIYRDTSRNGDFANPSTFRDGTAVLVARFRQQVVVNTISNAFSAFHRDRIASTKAFSVGRSTVRLGEVGETFKTYFSGQGNMPGPPSGFLGGYAVSD